MQLGLGLAGSPLSAVLLSSPRGVTLLTRPGCPAGECAYWGHYPGPVSLGPIPWITEKGEQTPQQSESPLTQHSLGAWLLCTPGLSVPLHLQHRAGLRGDEAKLCFWVGVTAGGSETCKSSCGPSTCLAPICSRACVHTGQLPTCLANKDFRGQRLSEVEDLFV